MRTRVAPSLGPLPAVPQTRALLLLQRQHLCRHRSHLDPGLASENATNQSSWVSQPGRTLHRRHGWRIRIEPGSRRSRLILDCGDTTPPPSNRVAHRAFTRTSRESKTFTRTPNFHIPFRSSATRRTSLKSRGATRFTRTSRESKTFTRTPTLPPPAPSTQPHSAQGQWR